MHQMIASLWVDEGLLAQLEVLVVDLERQHRDVQPEVALLVVRTRLQVSHACNSSNFWSML
jgi:hypothetical protein